MYTVYILQSVKSGAYYTGYTSDLERRVRSHNEGNTRSTKHDTPWKVVHTEEFQFKSEALRREREIKRFKGNSRFQRLVNGNK